MSIFLGFVVVSMGDCCPTCQETFKSHRQRSNCPRRHWTFRSLRIIPKLFLERPGISHPLARGPNPKEQTHNCRKSKKPAKLISLKLLHRTRQSRTELKQLTQLHHRFLVLLVIYCFVDKINYSTHNNFYLFSLCISLQHILVFSQNISSRFLSKIIKTIYI